MVLYLYKSRKLFSGDLSVCSFLVTEISQQTPIPARQRGRRTRLCGPFALMTLNARKALFYARQKAFASFQCVFSETLRVPVPRP